VSVPAHRRLDDEPPARQEVERRDVLRELERVAERRNDRACREAKPRRRGGDRAQEDERARPRRRGILVPDERIVAPVLGDAERVRTAPENHVLAHHHGVEPRSLRLDRHLDERRQVAR
jgi:hypothetical protein